MDKTFWFAVVFLIVVLLMGCEPRKVEIQMNPTGDTVERRLTATGLPDEELARMTKAYPRTTRPSKDRFVGTFKGRLPEDIGGAGWYLHYTSQMGEAFGYSERFKGNDDLNADFQKMQKGCDTLTNHLIGWFQAELGRDPHFPKLRDFLNTQLRHDLRNLDLYAWMGAMVADYTKDGEERGKRGWEFVVRSLQYLAERNYFDPQRLPEFLTAFFGAEHENSDRRLFRLLQSVVADKMGMPPGSIPPALAFMEDAVRAEKSLGKYLATTDEYRCLLAKWEKEKKTQKDLAKPDPWEVLKDTEVEQVLMPLIWGSEGEKVTLALRCTTQPYQTNGEWKAKENAVVWSQGIETRLARVPTLYYAFWSIPNESFQKAHFGRAFLTGFGLGAYCLWRNGLSPKQGREWDQFLAGLTPDESGKAKLSTFRFSDDPKPKPGTTTQPLSRAKLGIEILTEALNPPTTQPTTQSATQPASVR